MKTLSKAVAVASLLSAGVMSANVANAEVSFNASLVSDFVFRGQTFTDKGPALQGGADYSHDSGAYAGAWVSNLDGKNGDSEIEYDLYAGYWMEAGDFEIDLGYTTYNYVDLTSWNTAEVYANITTAGITASVSQDIDSVNQTYLALAYSMELPQELALDVAIGQTLDGKVDGEAYWGEDFTDMSASVSTSFDVVDVALTVTNINYSEVEDDTLIFLTASTEF